MKNCEHISFTVGRIERDFLGNTFSTRGSICSSCGSQLWRKTEQEKFYKWLLNLESSHRDRFAVQFTLTKRTTICLNEFVGRFPGVDKSVIVRALTIVYLGLVAPNPEFSKYIDLITNRAVYIDLSDKLDVRCKHKVQFSPAALLDLDAWSKIGNITTGKLVEEITTRLLSLCIEEDPKMKEFWEKTILPKVELIVKAA